MNDIPEGTSHPIPTTIEEVKEAETFTSYLFVLTNIMESHPWWKKRVVGTPLEIDLPVRAAQMLANYAASMRQTHKDNIKNILDDAPILSKYHGHRGFEVERFITDYEAWRLRQSPDTMAEKKV